MASEKTSADKKNTTTRTTALFFIVFLAKMVAKIKWLNQTSVHSVKNYYSMLLAVYTRPYFEWWSFFFLRVITIASCD